MGDSEVDKSHPRTHVRGELNLGKEELGSVFRGGKEGRKKWDERKERRGERGKIKRREEEEDRERKDEQ